MGERATVLEKDATRAGVWEITLKRIKWIFMFTILLIFSIISFNKNKYALRSNKEHGCKNYKEYDKKMFPSYYENYEKLISNRGSIIELAIDIEDSLTDIITWCYFQGDYSMNVLPNYRLNKDGLELQTIILDRLSFRNKIEILESLIKVRKPALWQNHKTFIKEIIKGLNKAREFRNLLAHGHYDLQKEETIQLFTVKKGEIKKTELDVEKLTFENNSMMKTQLQLWKLMAILNDYENAIGFYDNLVTIFDD